MRRMNNKIQNQQNIQKAKKKLKTTWILFGTSILCILITIFIGRSLATILENDVQVEPNSELTYYLNVSYDGVDKNGLSSSTTTMSEINSGTLYVEDKLPDGLEFKGFVTTADGTIGAIKQSDGTACSGKVIDDTNGQSVNTGVWNATNTEYTYHGLHYNANTRTVTFQIKNLKAGCELTVGIITETPTIDDPTTTEVETRRDFYNFATAKEKGLNVNSNTVHVFMGKENASLYNVVYQYTGTLPEGVVAPPATASYAPSTTVGVASNVTMEGYTFSGWTTTGVTVTNGSFIMPSRDVTFTGSFTRMSTAKVTYTLTGTTPDGYVLPLEKSYYPGTVVEVDSLKAGDVINGYRFLGWTTSDVTISENGDFVMPSSNVTLTGQFEVITYEVRYEFYDTVLPPNAENYLPQTKSYVPGTTITVQNVTGEPSGYKFLGWYKEPEFEMPESDVVIYGEWRTQNGTFEPTITKEVVGSKSYYRVGDLVRFKITVTNTANFAITEVMLKENVDGSKFVSGQNYRVLSDHIAMIDSIPASGNVEVFATYEVTSSDTGTIQNVAEIIGALASNDYVLLEKDYTATASFKIQSKIEICKAVSGSYTEGVFQFQIKGTTNQYETWVTLENNECRTIYVNPSAYQVKEIVPQEYTIKTVSGAINTNGATLNVLEGQNYKITYTNEFRKKAFYHSSGKIINEIVQGVQNGS